jgi:hypothetical protein
VTNRVFTCRIDACGEVFDSGFNVGAHVRLAHPDYEANKDRLAEKQRAYYEANKDRLAEKQRAYREEGSGWGLDDIAQAVGKPYWLVREWSTGGARDFPRPVVEGLWRPDDIRSWCERQAMECQGAA